MLLMVDGGLVVCGCAWWSVAVVMRDGLACEGYGWGVGVSGEVTVLWLWLGPFGSQLRRKPSAGLVRASKFGSV